MKNKVANPTDLIMFKHKLIDRLVTLKRMEKPYLQTVNLKKKRKKYMVLAKQILLSI